MGYLLLQRSHSPVCIIPRLSAVAREQVELEAVEVSGPEDARVEAGLLHERDDGLADVDRVEGVVVRLPRLWMKHKVQGGAVGFSTGKGEKLHNNIKVFRKIMGHMISIL